MHAHAYTHIPTNAQAAPQLGLAASLLSELHALHTSFAHAEGQGAVAALLDKTEGLFKCVHACHMCVYFLIGFFADRPPVAIAPTTPQTKNANPNKPAITKHDE